ncbi:MAG: PAAR domain-containing protein [Gemmataceae bacterium]
MPPAARVTDMHTCPMVTGIVPHVGGPILPPGCPTVLIGFLPAARVTDMLVCVGPPDMIAKGSPTVLIGNLMAARLTDMTVHGGVITAPGCPTVMIGEMGSGGGGGGPQAAALQAASKTGKPFCEICEKAKAGK